MKRKTYADMNCSIAQALDVVGDPWTLPIVRDAFFGITRFADFQARLGIPRNTLTDRLSLLVEHDILDRRRYQDTPPRYGYHLTTKGRDLRGVIIALLQWGDRWSDLPEPPTVLVDGETGRPLDPILVDRESGIPIDELNVTPMASVPFEPHTHPDGSDV